MFGLTENYITPVLPFEAKMQIWQDVGYMPSAQAMPFHASFAHERYIFGGWRGGKSYTSSMEVMPYPLLWENPTRTDDLKGLMWIVGPEYRQARAEFKYLLNAYRKLEQKWGTKIIEGEPSLPKDGSYSMKTTTGWEIQTLSSRHMEGLGSFTVDVVLVVEAGQHEKEIRSWMLGRTSEVYGPIIYSGTLEEAQEWYGNIFDQVMIDGNTEDLAGFSLPTWSNPRYKGEFDERLQKMKLILTTEEWLTRVCGKKSKPRGLVFREFMTKPDAVYETNEAGEIELASQGAICHVTPIAEFNPTLPVYLFVDPGEVYTVLAGHFVRIEQTSRLDGNPMHVPALMIFDEIYIHRGYFDTVRQEILNRPWLDNVEATYHDRATRQHHNQKSQEDLWVMPREDGGLGMHVMYSPEGLGILDGISLMHRWLLCRLTGQPLLYYHPRCVNAIGEFSKEKWPRDRPSGAKLLPLDKHNHARKAVCYGLYYRYGLRLPFEEALITQNMKPVKGWNKYGI